MLDLYSRRIVGWAMSDRITRDLTIATLKMVIEQRQPDLGLIHHSDQGSQYTDGESQTVLKNYSIQVNMNGVGSWYDNAPMESFFGTLKGEWVNHHGYRTHDEARSDIFYYVEAFYNRIGSTRRWTISTRRPTSNSTSSRISLTLRPTNRGVP